MKNKKAFIVRKLVHFIIGLLLFILTFFIEWNILLLLIVGGSVFSFVTFKYKNFQLIHKTSDASLGTLFYPLGILSSFLLLRNLPIYYFQTALLVLTVSDPMANLVGQFRKRNLKFTILRDKKSLFGIAAYTLSSLIIFYFFLPAELLTDLFFVFVLLSLAIALEVVSWRGSDNFTIPVGLSLFFIIQNMGNLNYLFMSGSMLILTVGCFYLFKWKILTRAGSLTAWLLAIYLLGALGLSWIFPVLFFFVSSVAFTKLNSAGRKMKEQPNGRNAWQVLANILWAVFTSILFLITQNELFIYFFIAFVASVTADTWASEIGPVFNKTSFSVADLKLHKAGITGGISFAGTLAAFAGSIFISAFSYYLFFGNWNWTIIGILSFAAILACFADTFLGAFVEGKLLKLPYFKNNNPESITPNDIVNLGGSFMASIFFLLLNFLVS